MAVSGIVREWYDDEGWGVIDSQDTPGGCWAHVTCVLVLGNPTLRAGQPVTMDCEPAEQDGYAFRAIDVWPAGQVPHRPVREETTGASAGYGSTLTISFDDADPPDPT